MSVSNLVGMNDAASHLDELLTRVAGGEEITITRHGCAIAKLLPVAVIQDPEGRRILIQQMRKLASRTHLDGLNVKEMIAEGRR